MGEDARVEAMGREYARRHQQRLNDEGHWEGRSTPADPDRAWDEAAEDWRDEVRGEMRALLVAAISTVQEGADRG